jgi:hypothetical protein
MHIKATGQQRQERGHWESWLPYFYVSKFWDSVSDATKTKNKKNGIQNMSNKTVARDEQPSTELYNSYIFMYKEYKKQTFRAIFSSGPEISFISRYFTRCVCIQ